MPPDTAANFNKLQKIFGEIAEMAIILSRSFIVMICSVLLCVQAGYITMITVLANIAWLTDVTVTFAGVDWGALVSRFSLFDRLLGQFEVLSYWIAFGLLLARRRVFLVFYVFAAGARFYFWIAFTVVPDFPSTLGYLATINEMMIIALIYAGFRQNLFR